MTASPATLATPSPPRPHTEAREFTLHRECGWSSVVLGLSLAILAEAFPVHLLVARANPALAWTLTATSASGLVWLVADAVALGRRPTRILVDALDLHVGRRWSARIPLADVASFTEVRGAPPPRRERGTLRAVMLGDPAFVIDLREPVIARGPGGIRREIRRVTLAPDDRARFAAELRGALAATTPGAAAAAGAPPIARN